VSTERATPVLYVDIDGTIRWGKDELGHFVNTAEDVHIFDGVPELLRAYRDAGWRIVGVSNQGGISLGHMTMADCAQAMAVTAAKCGYVFDKLAWCQHHPAAKDPEFAVCWCRKPRIGLIVESAYALAGQHREYYPPHMALFVGDRDEDRQCAENAGISFMEASEWRKKRWP
jgi:D-glycero-D-manno-heptose 1,7-bisphosphate phosphatase